MATDGTQLRLVVEADSEINRNIRAMLDNDRPEKSAQLDRVCSPLLRSTHTAAVDTQDPSATVITTDAKHSRLRLSSCSDELFG